MNNKPIVTVAHNIRRLEKERGFPKQKEMKA
jgi:hypothetical protein